MARAYVDYRDATPSQLHGGVREMHEGDAWDRPGDEEEGEWRHHRGGRSLGHGLRPRTMPVPFAGGPGSPGGPGFGRGFADFGPWMGGPRSRRGPRVRRGNVRAAAIALLTEEP